MRAKKYTEKIVIGSSDFSREDIEAGKTNHAIGVPADYLLETIKGFEDDGYEVKFETSFWRTIFGIEIFKMVAYKWTE